MTILYITITRLQSFMSVTSDFISTSLKFLIKQRNALKMLNKNHRNPKFNSLFSFQISLTIGVFIEHSIYEYTYIYRPYARRCLALTVGTIYFCILTYFLSVCSLNVAADSLFPLISLINLYSSWHKVQQKLWR